MGVSQMLILVIKSDDYHEEADCPRSDKSVYNQMSCSKDDRCIIAVCDLAGLPDKTRPFMEHFISQTRGREVMAGLRNGLWLSL